MINFFLLSYLYPDTNTQISKKLPNPVYQLIKLSKKPEGKNKIHDFIKNVLHQGHPKKLVDYLSALDINLSEQTLYQQLINEKSKYDGDFSIFKILRALEKQKHVISEQIKKLVRYPESIHKYVDIGTQGTYVNSLKNIMDINDITIISDTPPNFRDYLYGVSPSIKKLFKVYNRYIALDCYSAISKKQIPTNSVDLVTCVIGLHHAPPEKLTPFIQSIARILKPGGVLILREHDVTNELTSEIANMAHTLYNAIVGSVNFETEKSEIRNFKPIKDWINLVSTFNFKHVGTILFQDGDPTKNGLIMFEKGPDQLFTTKTEEKRPFINTFLSAPEWQNVVSAQSYGQFIQTKAFYEFPYWGCVRSFWHVFSESWRQARKTASFWSTLNDYTFMNCFIGVFMTIEYGIKAIISAPIRWIIGGAEPQAIQLTVFDPENQVEDFFPGCQILCTDREHTKIIKTRRYETLKKKLINIPVKTKFKILSIAGNKKIQFTIEYTSEKTRPLFENCQLLYRWSLPSTPNSYYYSILVDIEKIPEVIDKLTTENVKIITIHDF